MIVNFGKYSERDVSLSCARTRLKFRFNPLGRSGLLLRCLYQRWVIDRICERDLLQRERAIPRDHDEVSNLELLIQVDFDLRNIFVPDGSHEPGGRTLCIHSVVVKQDQRRQGIATGEYLFSLIRRELSL